MQPDRAPILAAGRGRLASPQWDGPEPAGTESRIFRPVDLSDLADATIEPPESVVEFLIYLRNLAICGAHGGVGKTHLALILLAHRAVGRSWAGLQISQGSGVFLSLEEPPEVVRWHLRRICDAYGLPVAEVSAVLTILDGSAVDGTLAGEVMQGGTRRLVATPGMAELEAAVTPGALVVIDNASDAFAGDEIQRRQVRAFLRQLAQMAARHDAAVLLLVHVDKVAARAGSNGESYSGSTAWNNTPRSRLALVRTEDGAGVELRHEKSNLGPLADPIALDWIDGVLKPAARDRVTEGVRAGTDADAVLELVAIAHDAGITVPANMSGSAQAHHALEALPEFGARFHGPKARQRVRNAVVALLRDGRLRRVEYRTPSRHLRERLEPVGTRADSRSEGSDCASSSARSVPPIPPLRDSRTPEGCANAQVPTDAAIRATRATRAEPCPKCDGEGCDYCLKTSTPNAGAREC